MPAKPKGLVRAELIADRQRLLVARCELIGSVSIGVQVEATSSVVMAV